MVTIRAIEKALRDKRGNVSAAAKALDLSRTSLYERIHKSDKLQEVLTESRETMLDNAETALYDDALNGNTTALIFFLKTQGKSRGYTERQELTGADGDALRIKLDWGDIADAND
jgi:GTP cyclohydrolase II